MSLADAIKAAGEGTPLPEGLAASEAIRQDRRTDVELARAAGVSRASVTRAKAKTPIDRETASKLARALCIPVSSFKLRKR